jgi:bla regulator protein BlaR1
MNPIADHLWQSTLFVGIVWLLTLALRRNRARVRHALWLAASIKFLIPFSLFIALGGLVARRTTPVTPQSKIYVLMDQVSQPFTAPAAVPMVPPTRSPLPALLLAAWACGFMGITCAWWVRWQRIRNAVRAGTPMSLDITIKAVSSPTLLEPGVFGIFRPILLLPEGIFDRLTPTQLQAVIAHELCHVRHRDNLIAAIHMFIETVFWFHPLVWWIGKRMVEERERACDEDVLREFGEPKAYAEGILNVCKLYVESPLACVSGVTGSSLKKRIEDIMANRIARRMTFGSKVLLAGICIAVIAGPLVVGLLHAQSSATARPSFEVASIRVNTTRGPGTQRWGPQEVDLTWVSLLATIAEAYQIPYTRISAPRDSATLKVFSPNYDITAKAAHRATKAELLLMLQTLFEERFKLALHHESRTTDVYTLVVAKGGPKLEESTTEGPADGNPVAGGYAIRNSEMWRFCAFLSGRMGRPVLDQTALAGIYNFTLKLDTMEAISSSDPDFKSKMLDWSSSSIFSDIQKQLGLQLVSGKALVDYLVIDHVEKPSEN